MKHLKEIFQKQGGMNLIRQYARAGCLGTAINQFLILGRSRTALEILRLSTSLKTKEKLEKKYRKSLEEFNRTYDATLPHERSNKVWVCWFQGIENAPEIVQKCYQSVVECLADREVILITYDNLYQYIEFPDYIKNKIDAGIIKRAHLSDLLRLELLTRYGGTWLDATVFCTSSKVPSYMLDSELFLFQCMKPGRDGHCSSISNWFITSCSNNKILAGTLYLLYEYWKENDDLVDYFLFHDFFQIVIDRYPEEWIKVIPFSNSTPHILLLRLFESFDQSVWDATLAQTPIHKLSYKLPNPDRSIKNSYYNRIMNMY